MVWIFHTLEINLTEAYSDDDVGGGNLGVPCDDLMMKILLHFDD